MSSGTPATPPLTTEDLDQTFGVLFIGFVVSTVLYGLTFFQTYIYFSRYPKDNVWTKSSVGLLSLLDTATSALMSQSLYYYLITMFASPFGLMDATTTFCAENGLAIFVTFLVQMFFTIRVWTVSGKMWSLSVIMAFISLSAFVFGITMTVQIFKQKRLSEFATPHMKIVAAMSQGLATLSDILITSALCYFLAPSRNPGGKTKGPKGWFDILVTYVINRGTCVGVIQFAYLLAFVIIPAKQIWMPFHLVVSKVYVNTLLAMLNTRDIYDGRGAYEEESIATLGSQPKLSFGVGASMGTSRSVRFNVVDSGITSQDLHNIELDKIDKSDVSTQMGSEEHIFEIGRDAKSPIDIHVTQETFTA